jgi:sugar O-acyltransferase (sialic acid O-acetyltransferase NeuD family)
MVSSPLAILIPLLNANEPEARLSVLSIEDGQLVEAGDALCTLETTKATQVLVAETSGYVRGLRLRAGQITRAGAVLCYLAQDPSWNPPPAETPQPGLSAEDERSDLPQGLRITQPALALAQEADYDLRRFPIGPLITDEFVRGVLQESPGEGPAEDEPGVFDPNSIIVYGGGGHGKSVLDLIKAQGIYRIAGVIDDHLPPGEKIMDHTTLGGAGALTAIYQRGIRQAANAVGGIGDIRVRTRVFELLASGGFHCPQLTHPSAVLEPSVQIGNGVQIFAQAYIGSDSSLGFGVIVNTGAIISHDCRLADYVNISPGAILAGGVEIGEGCLVGMGATINLGVRIGPWSRIGNGATVKADIPAEGLVPAGSIWPRQDGADSPTR